MEKEFITSPEGQVLRRKAERKLANLNNVSVIDINTLKLVHELEVHQIELEMQNEELKKSLQDTATATALYDFAPVGYFTIDQNRTIIQLNIRGAEMIGKERSTLIGSHLGHFISQDILPQFNEFIRLMFLTKKKQECKVSITQNEKPPVYVYLRGCLSEDLKNCLITASDITLLKLAEDELLKRIKFLEDFQKYFVGRELKMIELKKEINLLLKELGRKQQYLLTE